MSESHILPADERGLVCDVVVSSNVLSKAYLRCFVVTCLVFRTTGPAISNASCLRMSHSDGELEGLTNPQTSVHSPDPPRTPTKK